MPKGKLNVPGPPRNAPLAERFWSRVQKTDHCWLWLGVCWDTGYGRIINKGKQLYAHRVAWELINGPIPKGMNVLHRCDNPPCVYAAPGGNGGCLFLGTDADNSLDKVSKRRHAFGTQVNTAKLTEHQVIQAINRHANGETGAALARDFGISGQSMYAILKRKNWKHLT